MFFFFFFFFFFSCFFQSTLHTSLPVLVRNINLLNEKLIKCVSRISPQIFSHIERFLQTAVSNFWLPYRQVFEYRRICAVSTGSVKIGPHQEQIDKILNHLIDFASAIRRIPSFSALAARVEAVALEVPSAEWLSFNATGLGEPILLTSTVTQNREKVELVLLEKVKIFGFRFVLGCFWVSWLCFVLVFWFLFFLKFI